MADTPDGERDAPAPTAPPAGKALAPWPTLTPPRDMITAYLLLLLRNWSMHGYQLMQQLIQFGYGGSKVRHCRSNISTLNNRELKLNA